MQESSVQDSEECLSDLYRSYRCNLPPLVDWQPKSPFDSPDYNRGRIAAAVSNGDIVNLAIALAAERSRSDRRSFAHFLLGVCWHCREQAKKFPNLTRELGIFKKDSAPAQLSAA
jgi:hypothetical protein